MTGKRSEMFSLGKLYVAYRKAKAEAFYENTHFHALAFTKYEQNLDTNLRKLRKRLIAREVDWYSDPAFIGDYAYLPKSVDCSVWDSANLGHFRALDPRHDWQSRFNESQEKAQATLRLVIRPTVDFQVVSALWILKVGHLFDAKIDRTTSFANRLRRAYGGVKDSRISASGINISTPGLFSPYFSAYRDWREGGLSAMERALDARKNILAITMDIEKFYHRVSPRFLLRKSFLSALELQLTAAEINFTKLLLIAIETWYRNTPDFSIRNAGAIPVGLSASKIIANVLLAEFDKSIVKNMEPLYYGRYVDDIFLVLDSEADVYGAQSVTARIACALAPMIAVKENNGSASSLVLRLPYAKDSELIFAGHKQKIFSLSSAHGSDLVHHIRDQIRQQSSEYRLLPAVPESGIAMASRALLATPNATLQADALRKADVVSVRRLGFSLLLSDIETYAADLSPTSWRSIRQEFYGLVSRHVITPSGFFEFFGYIPRVFGLMLSCGDTCEAKKLIESISEVAALLGSTTTLGEPDSKHQFEKCLQQYALALLQAGLQAATLRSIELGTGYLSVLRKLRVIDSSVKLPSNAQRLSVLVKQVLLSDWGRRPYKEYWFQDQITDEMGPNVPREVEVKRLLRLGAIRRFRTEVTNLKVPHWPALAFPTRPLRVDEIGLVAPDVLSNPPLFRNVIQLLRGAEVASISTLGFVRSDNASQVEYFVSGGRRNGRIRVAVTSVETTHKQWASAAKGKQDRSASRYVALNSLINKILKESKKPDYIVMPELSVPLRWALRAARKLATNGVSLLAGVEYHRDRVNKKLRNDALVSLTTNWPGYASSVVLLQPKFEPAHGERSGLKNLLGNKGALYKPMGKESKPIVYRHRDFCFSVLICSDLTDLAHRNSLRGEIDALFALEWNPDIRTFSSLVESTSNDLHVFVVQVNNRQYGDSRIRAPYVHDYERDIVQVKGGSGDYYVLGEIDFISLRKEQARKKGKRKFKPIPIGYKMSNFRR